MNGDAAGGSHGSSARLLLDAVTAMSADLSLQGVLNRIVEAASNLLGARYAALGVLGPDRRVSTFVQYGLSPDQLASIGDLPRGRGVLGVVIDHPVPLRLADISEHPEASGFPPNHPRMVSFLGVPILIHGHVFGNLYVTEKKDASQFTQQDEEIAVALASAAAIAVENARLYEESAARGRWLEATAEVTAMLSEPVSTYDALQVIADRARSVADADIACIASGEDSSRLELDVVSGVPMTNEIRESLAVGRSLAARVVEEGDPLSIDDLGSSVGRVALGIGRLGPVILVPIRLTTGTQGVLGLGWTVENAEAYQRVGTAMPANFAEQATLALHLARVREDRERLIVLEDRDRIARDLHDLVIQRLFALGLSLQGIEHLVDVPDAKERINRAVDDVDITIREIRRTIFALGSSDDDDDIQTAATRLIERARSTLKFLPSLEFEGPVRSLITGDVEADVLAALAEALSNASRHAEPSLVSVCLFAGDRIRLTVEDDGLGMPDSYAESGLANIRSRATRRGGTFTLESAPGRGTRLTWSIPLQQRED